MKKARMIASVLEIVLGAVLVGCSFLDLVDEFWSGMGAALVVVGAIFLLRSVKYHTNEQYRNDVDIQTGDERNKYLSMKAWSWAGYLFVIIAAIGTIGFKLAGKEELMMLCSGAVCLMVFIYWISFMILRKKY